MLRIFQVTFFGFNDNYVFVYFHSYFQSNLYAINLFDNGKNEYLKQLFSYGKMVTYIDGSRAVIV